MPSPIAHSTAGYIVYKILDRFLPQGYLKRKVRQIPILLLISFAVSILPDIDAFIGILFGDLGRFHNNGTHSLIAGLVVALLIGLIASRIMKSSFLTWFSIFLLNYEGHIILDYFTYGRGVMLFWPISVERFAFPINLFYGLRWSQGLFSIEHIWTIASEGLFAILTVLTFWLIERKPAESDRRIFTER